MLNGLTWSHKDIKLIGYSMAGISTSIAFPQADVCFDVAQGFSFQIPFNHFLITHGHMDHASGLPYLLGQKAMRGSGRAQVYMPHDLIGPMQQIMDLWAKIENHSYDYDFRATGPGDEYPLRGNYFFRPFPTFHRIPSQGYTVFQHKKRLRAEFRGLDHVQLGALRRKGEILEEKYDEAVLSFTGDTKIEFCDSPQVQESRVLLMEVTYWDEGKPVEKAREWGHVHLDELIPRLDQLKCEQIVLIHTSARYSTGELNTILATRIPARHRGRVELFPRTPL